MKWSDVKMVINGKTIKGIMPMVFSGMVGCTNSVNAPAIMYTVLEDRYEQYPGRYELKVQLQDSATTEQLREIAEHLKETHGKSDSFIIFFYLPEQSNAWIRVDLPKFEVDVLPKLESPE